MVQSFTEEFSVVWEDPADAALTWQWDQMHMPRPLAPLSADVLKRMWADILSGRSVFVNGYMYDDNLVIPPPTPEVEERGVLPVWQTEYVPRIREFCRSVRSRDYDSMSAAELADSFDQIIVDAINAFRLTMVVIYPFMGPTFGLVGFAAEELGPEGPPLVATLLQGYDNGTAAAGSGLSDLAAAASRSPQVAEALRAARFDDLESVEGGPAFLEQFRQYLDEFGWRVESWGLLHIPTWIEDPRTPLTLIGRYVSDPNFSPAASLRRSLEQRDEAMRVAESKLSGEKLAQFKGMLEACQIHVPMSEDRARWQLTISGSLRVPAVALGGKLVDAGVLAEPNDVFFLTVEELKRAARNSKPLQKEIASRKANHERWERLIPAPFIGAAPAEDSTPPEMAPVMDLFFGKNVTLSTEEKVVKGNPASRGVARGRARIIKELKDAGRLQKGEVLVCPSTAPPWTPLFAIAAAIVTDSGGVLSHSAICAREYGIPCVVGTQIGTQKIPDGAMITVDGAEGVVRIEG